MRAIVPVAVVSPAASLNPPSVPAPPFPFATREPFDATGLHVLTLSASLQLARLLLLSIPAVHAEDYVFRIDAIHVRLTELLALGGRAAT